MMLYRGRAGPCLTEPTCVYDKNGKKMVSTEGGSNVEDPASFLANVFGGERFMDYVRPSGPLAFLHPYQGLIYATLCVLRLCRSERSRS